MEKIVRLWEKYYFVFLRGLGGTLWMAAVTVSLGTALGILVALMKMSRCAPLRIVSGIYTELLRGTPVLLQLYFFWLWLPKISPIELSDTACILAALVVNSSAYIAEIIRSGISAVDDGQREAAKSLGLSDLHTMSRIIMPQAIKNILPALANQFIQMIKETSLASVFFVGELMTSYKTFNPQHFCRCNRW